MCIPKIRGLWRSYRSSRKLTLNQGLEKVIPDTPKGETPVHLRDKQVFADRKAVVYPWETDVGVRKDGKNVAPDPSKQGL